MGERDGLKDGVFELGLWFEEGVKGLGLGVRVRVRGRVKWLGLGG